MNDLLPQSPTVGSVSQHSQQGSVFQRGRQSSLRQQEPAIPATLKMASARPPFARGGATGTHFRPPLPTWRLQRVRGAGPRTEVGVTGTEAERASERSQRAVGAGLSATMIPPQEASARRREIEDKLKKVKQG